MTDHYKFVTEWSPTGLSRFGIGAQPSPGHHGRAMLRMTPQITPAHAKIISTQRVTEINF